MALILRRMFYAKVGMADALVDHFKEGNKAFENSGIKTRVLSDYHSGRSDRVVVEWEVGSIMHMETAMGQVMRDSTAEFGGWEAKMNEMIHYAGAENWSIR